MSCLFAAMFHCIEVEGVSYLATDTNILCTDARYKSFVPLGTVGVVLFPVAIPLLLLGLLARFRQRRRDPDVAGWLGFAYAAYTEQMPYFELADMANKNVGSPEQTMTQALW